MLRDLQKQDPTMTTHLERRTPSRREANSGTDNRNREMQLMPESLARAHMQQRLRDAESDNRAARVVTARRLQRRAGRMTLRARRALAMAVMQ
ncbi:hypothetical protein [Streptomyces sp. HNM0574]|uniref:hypothetical protein n=1 Tax=Streptomyces sp. HNM0574 TaxID=2714954 RepID=UPI00146B50A4|nr:hypothetical protein [Streptomyces sp. HNM0574]NLU67263.1 hypothetical protein [Streptomyces sp. HNM0574]